MLAKDTQTLHPLVVAAAASFTTSFATEELQPQIAFRRHIAGGWIAGFKGIEGIAEQLLGQFLGKHLRVEVELLGAFVVGARGLVRLGEKAHGKDSRHRLSRSVPGQPYRRAARFGH